MAIRKQHLLNRHWYLHLALLVWAVCVVSVLWLFLDTKKAQALSIQELSELSRRFITKITLTTRHHHPEHIKDIIYGHSKVGYFKAQSWYASGNKSLTLEYVSPSYQVPIEFYAVTNQGQYVRLGQKLNSSPVPQIFYNNQVKITYGKLTNPFYLLGGALPRKSLIDPNFNSRNPELFHKNHHRFTYLMIVNRLGEIVWLHVPVIDGALFSSYLSPKEVGQGFYGIMFGKHSGYFEIVKYSGDVEREFSSKDVKVPFVMHHDYETMGAKRLFAVGNERKSLYQFTKNPADKGKNFISDTIIGIDLIKGEYHKLMSFTKYFHPGITPYITGDPVDDKKFVIWGESKADFDFLHINSVSYIDQWDGVLVSFRNISKIGFIDSKFSKLLWTLGSDKTDHYHITNPADQFRHQHTPVVTSQNTIMVFDNGITAKRSRVVEYLLDKNNTKMIWQFNPEPPLFSKDRSSIYLLAGGHVGVFFVKPLEQMQKRASQPHRDIYMEVDRQTRQPVGVMTITYPVSSPGYRMIPLTSISDDLQTRGPRRRPRTLHSHSARNLLSE
ncbi:MAG: aryl-sulfate sulfotransferase [Proteobacteria bacterium]|nr:aryl-sulfate sulfotransferase [Pseudomonadota bacterium]